MIKVLDKTFSILEKLAVASPLPCRIGELAEEFGINNATCSRILKELVAAGYAVRVSRLEGYAAGPRAWTFAAQVRYRERLIRAADPVIRKTSEELGASVLLAERAGEERYILLHHNGCRKLDIVLDRLSFHDLFETATGLLLTAFAPEREQRELLECYGDSAFRLFPPGTDLITELASIRREEQCVFRNRNQGIIAFPVRRNRAVAAVLGASVAIEEFTDSNRDRLTAGIERAAKQISQSLSTLNTIG